MTAFIFKFPVERSNSCERELFLPLLETENLLKDVDQDVTKRSVEKVGLEA